MKKIALLLPNNIWVSPYLSIYTRLFDEYGVSYDIISWDREGRQEVGIQYHYPERSRNLLSVFWSYINYARFLKKTIKCNCYDGLVVFTPQVGIFFSTFLEKNYKGRYIFDYRDLSIEQKSLFKKPFCKVLSNSYANVISSPGFKRYLPSGFDYIVSHNFNADLVRKSISVNTVPYELNEESILTIGALRMDMNPQVMDALGNVRGFTLSFVGKGISEEYLKSYAKSKGYKNVEFTGYYQKEDEPKIYEKHSMVNIVYPLIPSHISAISNRFYNSLIYKRPMIVSGGTIQGDYAKKYGVGLVIADCTNLKENILNYRKEFDFNKYVQKCNSLLASLLEDNEMFEQRIKEFMSF